MSFKKLKVLFPGITPDQFVLHDDGTTRRLLKWSRPEPKPTIAEIDAVSDAAADAAESAEALNNAFELSKKDKVLVRWIANIANIPLATARAQLKAIWDALP